jgi:RNA polymerase-binding transcription factor DksA
LEKRPEKPVKQAPPAKAPSAKPAPAVKGSASKKSPPTPAGKGSATAKTPPAPAPVAPAKAAATAKQTAPASKASIPPAKASAAKQAADAASDKPAAAKAQTKADALRARILERRSTKPIAFSLDEVREIAKTVAANSEAKNGAGTKTGHGKQRAADEIESKIKKVAQPHFVKAASLADILGYNPEKQSSPTTLDEDQIDPKFQRYYKLLVELREHVATGLDTHTEQTLKRSAKDDAGDLSSYAQHMADAGTDTFDRDFALSLVSSEQEALAEIEAAILRIKNGTYGVCELTGKPINKERLLAVPFARFSVESQAEVERTKRRTAHRAGLFGESEDNKYDDDGGSGGDE